MTTTLSQNVDGSTVLALQHRRELVADRGSGVAVDAGQLLDLGVPLADGFQPDLGARNSRSSSRGVGYDALCGCPPDLDELVSGTPFSNTEGTRLCPSAAFRHRLTHAFRSDSRKHQDAIGHFIRTYSLVALCLAIS